MPSLSDALPCREYVEDCVFVGGGWVVAAPMGWSQGRGPCIQLYSQVLSSLYYCITSLTHSFPETFHAIRAENVGLWGRGLAAEFIHICKAEAERHPEISHAKVL